jgi:hypothetical protein
MKFLNMSLVGLASASTAQNNAMRKVISLLEGMKATIESETAAGKKDAEEYADWCIKSITETEADVKYGAEKVEELSAAAEDGAAQAAAKAADAAECAAAIGKSQAAQKEADEARKAEHNTFVGEEAELVEADTMLGKAYSVLKRSLSLVQTGAKTPQESYTEEVVAALGQIIESAWVDSESSQKLTAFLEDADSLSMKQPQAKTSNYESKSGGILTAIQQMQEKNAEVLGKLREKEMSSRHKFELLMQDLKNTEENKGEQMSSAKEAGAKSAAKGKEAESAGAEAADTLASDKKELAGTKAGCAKAAREWSTREAEANEEMGVIAKAVEILSGKFGSEESFIQVNNSTEEESKFARRQAASQLLRKLGHEYNQFALIQAAQSAQDDPFVKVRGMISEMITKLEEEQRKEAGKEAKCKADKAKGEKDLKNKKADFEKLMSREDGSKAKVAKLTSEVADLNTQLQELAASLKEATAFRAKEKKENDAVVKDSAESIEALSGAIKTLTDFYGADETALVQVGQPKSDSANVIIEMLQTAQEDFEKLKQETEAAEANAVDTFEKLVQEGDVTKAKKNAMVEGKTNEIASVKVQLSQISEDLTDAEKALTAASDFLKGVKEACANKAMSFEERQKRRGAEIAGLREALEILSADESFLQTDKFMAKRN